MLYKIVRSTKYLELAHIDQPYFAFQPFLEGGGLTTVALTGPAFYAGDVYFRMILRTTLKGKSKYRITT